MIISHASAATFTSGPERTALVELYTSEGCSSCPPADAWFTTLKDEPGLWKGFVPAAFHVPYWDHIGWKDPLAFAGAESRQRALAQAAGESGLYTPQAVVDGKDYSWRRMNLPELLKDRPKVGVLQVTVGDGRWTADFKPQGDPGDFVAHFALLGMGIGSRVSAGENAGKLLVHDFAVLQLSRDGKFTRPAGPAHRLAFAAWVTKRGDPAPVQAVGGYLPESKKK